MAKLIKKKDALQYHLPVFDAYASTACPELLNDKVMRTAKS
jgi:hypothetical protein